MRRDPPKVSGASDREGGPSLGRQLAERLAASFRRAGWRVTAEVHGTDLVVAHGRRRYAVEVKLAREPRKDEVLGALASAILQSRFAARAIGAKPLAVVGAQHLSDAMTASIRDYAARYADESAYGILDLRGRLELHGAGLSGVGGDSDALPMSAGVAKRSAPSRVDPFSDLGQWLLKVLIAPRLSEKHLTAPRVKVRNAKHLAQVANVSVPHASRQVAQLRSEGFLDESSELRLVRIPEILDRWRGANRRLPLDIPARWLFPAKNGVKQLKDSVRRWSAARVERTLLPQHAVWLPATKRVSLAMFAACDALGIGLVSGAAPHLYAEDVSDRAFEELGLVPVEPGQRVDVFVRQPKYPEAVFRGAVWQDGVASSDILQCWLDVGDHPVRGAEQAQHIWNRVLKPRLVES
jgi:hypothetical protein